MASNYGGSRRAEPKGEIANRLRTARKYRTDKAFGYVAVHDMIVGFTPFCEMQAATLRPVSRVLG
jgi:hypothetical protein